MSQHSNSTDDEIDCNLFAALWAHKSIIMLVTVHL